MKKVIAILCVAVTMVCLLTACGKKFTCDECEKESKGEKYEISMFGEERTVCKECKDKFETQMGK